MHARDFGAAFRYTFRTCLACALASKAVEPEWKASNLAHEQIIGLVTLSWYGKRKPIQISIENLDEIARAIDESLLQVASIDCPDIELPDLLSLLQPIAHEELDVIRINGVAVFTAITTAGELEFVPDTSCDGVEILHWSSASWLPGGPCVMEQHESILRYADLFWVDTSGDSETSRKIAGRFDNLEEGFCAAVSVSTFCQMDASGKVICELDDWGNEE